MARSAIFSGVRLAFSVAVVVLAAATLAACSDQSSNLTVAPTSSAQTFSQIGGAKAEYNAAAKKYVLPTGYSYPPAPFTDVKGNYQTGYGEEMAVTFWNCSWGKAYLRDQAGNSATASADLTQYSAMQDTDTFKQFWDPESMQKPFKASIDSAKLGDPSAIEQYVSANCA